jgi:hypothetical protein
MATRKDVEDQFIRWNVLGTGSDRAVSGNWTFRRHVLFYQRKPFKRFVSDSQKKPLLFVSNPDSASAGPSLIGKAVQYRMWGVPDIGVRSRFEGDEIGEIELHERNKYLFIAELAAYKDETIRHISGAELANEGSNVLSPLARNILAHVGKMYTRWHNYSLTFALGWDELPEFYRDEIVLEIERKIERYHDPKSVAMRERANARRIAKKAFDLA